MTAYRLAEAGRRVLVLERGRPYPPGSFTRSPYRARESFWDPPRGLVGMYHYWSFKGIDALVKLRSWDLRKPPSLSEGLDWAQSLCLLGADTLSADLLSSTLHLIVKHQSDAEKVRAKLPALIPG